MVTPLIKERERHSHRKATGAISDDGLLWALDQQGGSSAEEEGIRLICWCAGSGLRDHGLLATAVHRQGGGGLLAGGVRQGRRSSRSGLLCLLPLLV